MKKRFIEIAVKVVVAALTAFLTAITTTSCMGYGPLYGPLPKIVQISQMKKPLAVAGGFSVKLHSRVGSCVPAVASQQSWSAYCVILEAITELEKYTVEFVVTRTSQIAFVTGTDRYDVSDHHSHASLITHLETLE